MLETYGRSGRRPQIWWEFSDLEYPGYYVEQSFLFGRGLLAEEEQAELLEHWRREFDRAHAPGFAHVAGEGKILTGPAAVAAHLKWADVPAALVQQWTAERRPHEEARSDHDAA